MLPWLYQTDVSTLVLCLKGTQLFVTSSAFLSLGDTSPLLVSYL